MLKHNPLPCFVTMLVWCRFLLYASSILYLEKRAKTDQCALKSSHVKNGCVSPHPDGLCIDAYNKNRHHTSIVTKQGKGLCFSMQPSYTMTFQARMACNFFVHTKFVFFSYSIFFFPVSCIKVGAAKLLATFILTFYQVLIN